MNTLCIDLGNKRCGIAISEQNIAFPLKIIPRVELIKEIKKLVLTKNISKIIVGLPYDLYGVKTQQLDKTLTFIKKLKNIFSNTEIIGHDERFSSFEADHGYDDHRDDVAAQCILQSYLDSIK